jgi:ankyrin repeat protein
MSTYYHDAYQIYEILDKSYQNPPDPDAMRDLFIRRPSEATREFVYGQTLLHKSFEFFSHKTDVIDVILEAYPQSLEKEDDHGYLPIHRLLSGQWGDNIKEMTSKIINAFPDCLVTSTSTGLTPLHIASKRSECADVVKLLLCFPDACQYRDHLGKFPLDHALEARDPNQTIVQLLVSQHPVLLSFPDESGSLKIHRTLKKCSLLQRSSYDEVIEILVSGCESSLRVQDVSGCTPLLIACTQNHSLAQIYSLVRKWPEQVTSNMSKSIFDSTAFNGELFYPSLISKSANLSNVKNWLLQDPGARFRQDLFGRLPIHYAVISNSEKAHQIVQCLLFGGEELKEAHEPLCAQQLSVKDNNERLPIHLAAASPSCRPNILTLLIDTYSKGLMAKDKDGRLPWHYGECSRQDLVFETTANLFPEMEIDLELVPEEIQWDVISVKGHDCSN